MNPLKLINDGYERKARLYPALILIAPLVATVVAATSAKLSALRSLSAVVVTCGGSFLLAQLARDAGKRCEKTLFVLWGGMPSVVIFRHRDTRIDPITKARYHKKLSGFVKGAKPPSPAGEDADPTEADRIYEAWSTYLRINTRNTKTFGLLFNENVNYGYRRNLWGLRPWGIITSALSGLAAASWCVRGYAANSSIGIEMLGAAVLALIFLGLWIFRFTPAWVRVPAEAYAERLAEAIDILDAKSTSVKETKAAPSKKQNALGGSKTTKGEIK